MNLYNFEVIDEDAFMQWKEELNDVHPGKGQALFQVRHTLSDLEIFRGRDVRTKAKLPRNVKNPTSG